MGQAVMDLPDPLDAPPPPASMAGTDDLLSQLAGDEIDRLLAEAEVERPPTPSASSVPSQATPAPSHTTAAETESAHSPSHSVSNTPPSDAANDPASVPAEAQATAHGEPAGTASAEPPGSPTPTPTQHVSASTTDAANVAAVSAPAAGTAPGDDLDSLLNELTQANTTPATPASPTNDTAANQPAKAKTLTEQVPEVLAEFDNTRRVADAAPEPAPSHASPAGAADSPDAVMSAAEREALQLPSLAAEMDAAEQQDAAESQALIAAVPTRLRPAIWVLERINAPLSFVPDRARDACGKAGIVTLVNSLAVLIYVLFVRH